MERTLASRGHEVVRAAGATLAGIAGTPPDIVHVHDPDVRLPLALTESAPGGARVPVVCSVHDLRPVCPGANQLSRAGRACHRTASSACLVHGVAGRCSGLPRWPFAAARRVRAWRERLDRVRRASIVVVASRYVGDWLVRTGVPGGRIVLVPYPVELPAALPAVDAAAPLVFAGRLVEPDKGLGLLLDALTLSQASPSLEVIGDGPARAELERRVAERGLTGRVRFLGERGHAETLDRIGAARAVVVPSRWPEPCGIVGLEAAARARPVVAFDVGGMAEWLRDGETGLRVRAADPVALARRIDALLATPAVGERLGRAAREGVRRRHGLTAHAETLEALYRDAVHASKQAVA